MRKKPKKEDPLRELRIGTRSFVESNRKTVSAQESHVASAIGGDTVPGSGCGQKFKSDAFSERYQVEAKQTQNMSLSLTVEWLRKISREALRYGRVPMMHIRFLNGYRDLPDKDWVVIPEREFKRIYDLACGQNGSLGRWDGGVL